MHDPIHETTDIPYPVLTINPEAALQLLAESVQ